jgi:hypothetical protein
MIQAEALPDGRAKAPATTDRTSLKGLMLLARVGKALLNFGFVINTTAGRNARLIRLLIGCSGRPSS